MKRQTSNRGQILLLGSNIWYFGEGLLGPLFAVFTQQIGGNILDITWAWAIYLLVTGILLMIVGMHSGKTFRDEHLLILGYGIHSILTFCYLLVETPLHLFILQAGFGFSLALSWPTWDSLYSQYHTKEHAGHAWGLAHGQAYLLTGIAVLLGGLIVSYLSFRTLFIIMGTIQLIATGYQARILRHIN